MFMLQQWTTQQTAASCRWTHQASESLWVDNLQDYSHFITLHSSGPFRSLTAQHQTQRYEIWIGFESNMNEISLFTISQDINCRSDGSRLVFSSHFRQVPLSSLKHNELSHEMWRKNNFSSPPTKNVKMLTIQIVYRGLNERERPTVLSKNVCLHLVVIHVNNKLSSISNWLYFTIFILIQMSYEKIKLHITNEKASLSRFCSFHWSVSHLFVALQLGLTNGKIGRFFGLNAKES